MSEELIPSSGNNYSASSIQVLEGLEAVPPCISAILVKRGCTIWCMR